jgi:dihydrolipoamide dehydrogenase
MDADLLVVGGGAAGVAASLRARELGASVALVEQAHLGGTCLHRGCVPSVTAVEFAAGRLAEHGGGPVDFSLLHHRQNNVVKQISTGTRLYLEQSGVTLIEGEGLLVGPGQVVTQDRSGGRTRLAGRAVLLAPGAGFVLPSLTGIDLPGVWTTDHALNADAAPADLLVYGGGFIGVEWAQFFQVFGSRVTLLEPGPMLLPGEDTEIAEVLQYVLAESGIEVVLNAPVEALETVDGGRLVAVGLHGRREAERFLVADCRQPLLAGLPLAELGLATHASALVVDAHQATSVSGIYAAGDVAGGRMLSPSARAQGTVAAEAALGLDSHFEPAACPRAYHVRPEVAAVGLTAAEAQGAGYEIVVGRSELSYNARALTLGQELGLAKVIARCPDGKVLGVHLIGPQATELIGQAVLAVRLEALAEDLASIVHGHPTLSETIAEAAQDAVRQLLCVAQPA